MRRTQIYLDEDQKRALRALALDRDSTVSDLVRQAVDRLLRDEAPRGNWAEQLGDWQGRLRARLGDVSEESVDRVLAEVRAERRPHTE